MLSIVKCFVIAGNRVKDWYNTAPSSRYLGVGVKPEEEEREKASRYRDRYELFTQDSLL